MDYHHLYKFKPTHVQKLFWLSGCRGVGGRESKGSDPPIATQE